MKNINKLSPKVAIIFKNEQDEELTLIQGETVVELITDKSEYDHDYKGLIRIVNEDGIGIDDRSMIFWDYIKEIKIV